MNILEAAEALNDLERTVAAVKGWKVRDSAFRGSSAAGVNESFRAAYRKLESRMKDLAEEEEHVFVPSPEPKGPVQFVFICMEPSLGRWARPPESAKLRIECGFRNFLPSDEVALLHFCIRQYLCSRGEPYHITDFSKGAMPVGTAAKNRTDRWRKWYPLLLEELDLVAAPTARIVAVGDIVYRQLQKLKFPRPLIPVMHYSALAGRARNRQVLGHEAEFNEFSEEVSKERLMATAREVLDSAQVPIEIRNQVLEQLKRFELNRSRLKLMFIYKRAFHAIGPSVSC
jgi:hypothetical protein